MNKLIYRIPGLRFFISSLPGLALRMLAMSTRVLKALPVNFISKDTHLVLSMYTYQHQLGMLWH